MFEDGAVGNNDYGNENSFFISKEFDGEPDQEIGNNTSQNTEEALASTTNPSEGKFFWHNSNLDFTVTPEQVDQILTFKIANRESGMTLDRFVFSLNNSLDVQEIGLDNDPNELDTIPNSKTQTSSTQIFDTIYPLDFIPFYESDEDILEREQKLQRTAEKYIAQLRSADVAGQGNDIVKQLMDEAISQADTKPSLRTLVALTNDPRYFPQWKSFVANEVYQRAADIRQIALDAIKANGGQINDLAQVTPIRTYTDLAWLLFELDMFNDQSNSALRFKHEFESFMYTYVEDTAPYFDGPYYTTGYNKEVFAQDISSTMALLYANDPLKFIKFKQAFDAFWVNVTQTSYDADNSPHYDANTGFHIILNMALRHGLEQDVIDSPHLKRVMDRMARSVMSSGQSAKWGKSMEAIKDSQIQISAGTALPWNLKLGYKFWGNPFYLYVARKYAAFHAQEQTSFSGQEYLPDLWPIDIDAHDISLANATEKDYPTRAPKRITSTEQYNGLLLGRDDSSYVEVQDKLLLSTSHHPRSPFVSLDLSYTQHKAARDHRSGIDSFIFNGAHTITRMHRYREANKTNGIYINPAEYQYPIAPYESFEVASPNSWDEYIDVMGYEPDFDYHIDSWDTGTLSKEAVYGSVNYNRYQYDDISSERQIVLLNNGIAVVRDKIQTSPQYVGGHNGGTIYQALNEFIIGKGDNWVLLSGQQKQLPSDIPADEHIGSDTLIMFLDSPEQQLGYSLTTNPYDPQKEQRSWFSAHQTLRPEQTTSIVSLIVPLKMRSHVDSWIKEVSLTTNDREQQDIVTIPYSESEDLAIHFSAQNSPEFKITTTEDNSEDNNSENTTENNSGGSTNAFFILLILTLTFRSTKIT